MVFNDLLAHPGFTFYVVVSCCIGLYLVWQLWKVQDLLGHLLGRP